MGGLLMALRVRGETVDEITGAVTAMRAKMLRVEAPPDADRRGRHRRRRLRLVQHLDLRGLHRGRRRRAGRQARQPRAVVALGRGRRAGRARRQDRSRRPSSVGRCIREAGIGFMFAPAHHPAMKNVGPTRVELGTRTIFNLLGPLSNPAGVKRQMVGVFSRQWIEPLAQVLKNLGSESVWVVHGSDGLDEITTAGPTIVAALENGTIRTFEITPEDVGLAAVEARGAARRRCRAQRAGAARRAQGQAGPLPRCRDPQCRGGADRRRHARRISRKALRWRAKSIDSGEAEGRLDRLIAVSNAAESASDGRHPRPRSKPTSARRSPRPSARVRSPRSRPTRRRPRRRAASCARSSSRLAARRLRADRRDQEGEPLEGPDPRRFRSAGAGAAPMRRAARPACRC